MTPAETEAANLWKLHQQNPAAVLGHLESQFNTLHARAQSLIGLATVVITVTGFSGKAIAGTGVFSQVLVVSGLLTVISGAVWIFCKVLPIRWLTSQLGDASLEAMLPVFIDRRNHRTRAYQIGGGIVCAGLFFYCIAISLMLLLSTSGA